MTHELHYPLNLFDSVSDFAPGSAPALVVTGSHCGLGVAQYLAGAPLIGFIGNDAGIGLRGAGLVALRTLARFGIPAAAVSHESARIGWATETLDDGVVSATNGPAKSAGVSAGMPARVAAQRLRDSSPVILPPVVGYRARRRVLKLPGRTAMILADSASLVEPSDAGAIVVTGSHGGLVGGAPHRGLKAAAAFAAFSDAGRGRDGSGVARLLALDAMGVPAVVVAAGSASIGSAVSTYRRGIVSAVNELAGGQGYRLGEPLHTALWRVGTFR